MDIDFLRLGRVVLLTLPHIESCICVIQNKKRDFGLMMRATWTKFYITRYNITVLSDPCMSNKILKVY